MKLISILIFSIILLLSSTSSALASVGEASNEVKEVDGYKVALAFAEGEARVGQNKLSIEIEDAQDEHVGGARVTVIAKLYAETSEHSDNDADGMSMEETNSEEETSEEAAPLHTVTVNMEAGENTGEYEGELEFEEAGHWMIKVVFQIQSQERIAEFTVDVNSTPSGWVILWSFIGINIGIITIAAIMKIKRSKTPAAEGTK